MPGPGRGRPFELASASSSPPGQRPGRGPVNQACMLKEARTPLVCRRLILSASKMWAWPIPWPCPWPCPAPRPSTGGHARGFHPPGRNHILLALLPEQFRPTRPISRPKKDSASRAQARALHLRNASTPCRSNGDSARATSIPPPNPEAWVNQEYLPTICRTPVLQPRTRTEPNWPPSRPFENKVPWLALPWGRDYPRWRAPRTLDSQPKCQT
jgi:putative ATPase